MRSETAQPWWAGAVGYQVYIRSFADSDGDGMGDLEGIRLRLGHVASLGVDALWVTPFYPSPCYDHGYDVADYCDVDPRHGTLADFDRLVADAHDVGLRVMIDIVPNHTSFDHPWFRSALRSRDDPYRSYYHWRDSAPGGGPPNNWVSHFGGSAWTLDPASGQYYLHLFLPEQPDLDWTNPAVADEFDEILAFWCERGVDGFRIDVAHALVKDPLYRDNPQRRPVTPGMDPSEVFAAFEHRYDVDQNPNVVIYRRWNRLVEPYGVCLLGETGARDPVRLARYHDGGAALHRNFYLWPVWTTWEPVRLRDGIRGVHLASPDSIAWVTDNHDSSRSPTRFGGGDRGRARSLALTTLMFSLGGTPFLYQGQELALVDGEIAFEDLEDPISTRNPGAYSGRDGSRTAMPWEAGPGNAFTRAVRPWLPATDRHVAETVAGQADDPGSYLARHRRLIALRRGLPDLTDASVAWLESPDSLLVALRRGGVVVACNLDEYPAHLDLPPGAWSVAFSSGSDDVPRPAPSQLEVPPETTLLLTAEP